MFFAGPFIICEVYDIEDIYKTTQLRDVPLTIQFSFMNNPYNLRGAINLRPSRKRSSDTKSLGHFTAISRRRDESWIQYDDLKTTQVTLPSTFNANIQLLLYTL